MDGKPILLLDNNFKLGTIFSKQQPINMKTKKTIFFTFAILCFSYMATAQRGVRIGYIDMEYILESVPEYREASIQLEGKVQRWKQDLEKSQKEVDQMKLNLAT